MFHVVKVMSKGFHVGYHIYRDNKIWFKPPRDYSLRRSMAYEMVRLLNEEGENA